MARFKHYQPEAFLAQDGRRGLEGKVATHHAKLARLVGRFERPVVLELGTARGLSTALLLSACERAGGRMVSVDIEDCSDVAESPAWRFIQADDLDVEAILEKAPFLREGISLLHVDSLHAYEHVAGLLLAWYPYVVEGGFITFHDIDPAACGPRGFKPSPSTYQDLLGDARAAKDFFYANENDLFLAFHFGATGMGVMQKLSPLGARPRPPAPTLKFVKKVGIRRTLGLLARAVRNLLRDRLHTARGHEDWRDRYDVERAD
ncbi:MAG: class I SAM-dependent methyltransferase [Planctomycetota bacterium]